MRSSLRLTGQGFWAIIDQALFAGASFVLNVLLARWLGPAEYGVFGIAFTVFLLLGLTHTSLVIEPMLVFGSGRWRLHLRTYMGKVLGLMALIAAGGAVLIVAATPVLAALGDGGSLATVLLTLTWAGPCVILQWTMRRLCYVRGRPDIAASGGVLYLGTLLGAVHLARMTVGLDARTAFVVMAAASLLVAAFLAWRFVANLPPEASEPPEPGVLRAHWEFGRWVLASSVLGWSTVDVYYLVLPPQHGLAAVGAVRAAFNLVLPMLHVLTALSTVALPWFVAAARRGTGQARVRIWWLGLTALALAYGVLLVTLAPGLVALVYGDTFDGIVPLVRVFALLPVVSATSAALSTVLRALERSRDVFVAASIAAIVGAAFGIPVTWVYGGFGAVIAFVVNSSVYAAAIAWRLRGVRNADEPLRPGAP